MTKIIAAPVPEVLPRINRKVRQYDIEVCIHTLGPPLFEYEEQLAARLASLPRRDQVARLAGLGSDLVDLGFGRQGEEPEVRPAVGGPALALGQHAVHRPSTWGPDSRTPTRCIPKPAHLRLLRNRALRWD